MKINTLLLAPILGVFLLSCQKSSVKPDASHSNLGLGVTASGSSNYIVGNTPYDTHTGIEFTGDIKGNWRVVSDSAWNGGSLPNNDTVFVIKKYTGVATDRYNFLSNGMLYISLNGVADTASYIQDKNTLQLSYTFYNNQNIRSNPYNNSVSVDQLNDNTIAVYRSLTAPAGFYEEKIILTKNNN